MRNLCPGSSHSRFFLTCQNFVWRTVRWHPPALAYLRPYLTVDNRLKIETMIEGK